MFILISYSAIPINFFSGSSYNNFNWNYWIHIWEIIGKNQSPDFNYQSIFTLQFDLDQKRKRVFSNGLCI